MRCVFLVSLLLLGGVVALAQEDSEEPGAQRLRLEVDPHGLAKELARIDSAIRAGKSDDALAVVDRLLRDPRSREGFEVTKPGAARGERILASLDRALRAKILAAPDATRAAFDARFDDDARHLEEQGRLDASALAKLVALYPFSTRAPRAALELGERELERGRADAAAAWLDELVSEQGERAGPELLARARLELVAALALAGRDGEAERVLDKLAGPALEKGRALLASGKKARAACAPVLPEQPLPAVAWAHDVLDFYETAPSPVPLCEPATDGDRLYVQDGSHALALSLLTGKLAWRASLRVRDEGFHEVRGRCRVALGPSVVACALPFGALVGLDRASGEVLYRLSIDDLRKAAKIEDDCAIVPSLVVVGGTVVVPLEAQHADDELTLLGLDARSGALLWKTFVVGESADPDAADAQLVEGPDGVFLLTNRGVVADVDPRTGSVVWLWRYPSRRDTATPPGGMPRFGRRMAPPAPVPSTSRPGWLGFVRGKLLVAPADAPRLFVLDPRTGEKDWEVDDKGAPVVGAWRAGVIEIQADKSLVHVWKEIEKKHTLDVEVARFVGTPVLLGDAIFLPLEKGIVRVDLAARGASRGAIVCDWAALDGRPANLACSNGTLLAVTAARTTALASVEAGVASVPSDAKVACRLLGDERWRVREAAFAVAVGLGEASRAELEREAQSADPEMRIRASDALEEIARKGRRASWEPRIKPEWIAAKPGLLDRLTHRNAEVRLGAVRDLGTLGGEALALLKELLKDPDERVQGWAAVGLLDNGDRAGIDRIAKLIESAAVADRLAALKALGAKGKTEDLPLFEKAAQDEDSEVRSAAIAAAIARCEERAVPLAKKLLTDKDEKVRSDLCAALALAKIAASVSAPLFAELAKDPLRAIREQALQQLGMPAMRHEPAAIAAFAGALVDPDPSVARIAREQVVGLRPEDVGKLPREAIEKTFDDPQMTDEDRFHFVQIAETIVEARAPFAAAALAKAAYATKSATVRERALKVLFVRSQLPDAFTAADVMAISSLTLVKEVPNGEAGDAENVRFDAYQALANGRGPGITPALMRGLDETNEQVRAFVERALKTLVDPAGLAELLRREATSEKPNEQAAAAAALDAAPDEKAEVLAPVLLEGLADNDARIRARAWKRIRDLAQADEDLGFFEPDGKAEERLVAVRRAASWWWRRGHKGDAASLLKDLAQPTPAERWRSAKKLTELEEPCFRSLVTEAILEGLAKAIAGEKVEYVLREELEVMAALTGKPCAIKEGASAEERARAVKVALEWKK